MGTLENFFDDINLESDDLLKYIINADSSDLFEFVELFNYVINNSTDSVDNTQGFNFIANSTLSGLPYPCANLECRIQSIRNLAKNATLYADSVFLQNPLERYTKYEIFDDEVRYDLISDIILIKEMKPLIKEKVFQFASSRVHFCHDCYIKFQKENSLKDNLNVIDSLLEEYVLDNISFYLLRKNNETIVEISGNSDLLEHPIVVSFRKYIPAPLDQIVINNNRKRLNKKEVKESKLLYIILDNLMSNLSYQDFYSRHHSSHILTDTEFDFNLVKLLGINTTEFSDSNRNKANTLSNINHILPFADNVPIDKLLKLRREEGESFCVYRNKLDKIVKRSDLTERTSREIFMDEINPEINKINLTLKNNKKLLWGNIKSNIFLASTYVSASLYTGILPSNIETIVASIGGFGFASKIGHDIIKMIKEPDIRENEFYFLWKIKNEKTIKI